MNRRGVLRWIGRGALGVLGLLVLFLALTPLGHYLVRAAVEEGKILARRRSIPELVSDSLTDAAVRQKLRIVLDARQFATDSVKLQVKKSFTTYSRLDHDTLVLVLSAAYRDRLESYTWWFPVVGRVPYKGFFDYQAARNAARDLSKRGFDTYLRPASAFSTLGFFNDPLVTTTLRADSLDLVNTVIHEVTHNTFYARGQAVFNESFANFVGARGAEWFFRSRGQLRAAELTSLRWEDDKLLGTFWTHLRDALASAYNAHPTDSTARLTARDSIYARARRALVEEIGPRVRTLDPVRLGRVQLDNAALLARRIYLTDLDVFDAVYEREGRDLRKTIETVVRLAKDNPKDPYGALHRWLQSP
jgi:predicted aminopeptidase